jgi:hypothetical protein
LINVLEDTQSEDPWWYTPVTLGLGRLRKENHKFKSSLAT